ncbi:MAG: hypothetical protein ACOYMA_14920 [Bacteroidia bacterium]
MNIIPTFLPQWVSILFIITFPIGIYLLAKLVKDASITAKFTSEKANANFWKVIGFFTIYLIYVSVLSFQGFFSVNSLPPRILLFTAIPLLLFLFIVVFRSKIYWTLLESVNLQSLIMFHTFRFIGVFFIIIYSFQQLPKWFALSAGIGDVLAAASAIWVAHCVNTNKTYFKKLTLVWNIVGFWDIINVVVSAVITTKLSIDNGSQDLLAMANFPYCWIAAFAPATIIFMHISIFKKLKLK